MTLVLQQVVADLEKQVGTPSSDKLQNPDYCATFNENSKAILASMLLECSRSLDAEKSVADSLRGKLEEQNTLRNLAIDCQAREAAAHQAALNTRQRQEELEALLAEHQRMESQLQERLKVEEEEKVTAQSEAVVLTQKCEELDKLVATHEETELELKKKLKARDEEVCSRIREEVDSNAEQLNLIIDKLKGELSYAERGLRTSEAENVVRWRSKIFHFINYSLMTLDWFHCL